VPTPRSLLTSALSILTCAALLAIAEPAVAVARLSNSRGHARGDRDGCAKSSAHATRRARIAAHACRSTVHRPRIRRPAKLHQKAAPRVASPSPVLSTAATEQSPVPSEAATIASVLATPCQNTELTPEAENISLARAAVLCLINRKRAENGESPLTTSPKLEQAAEGHCQELIADDYFAHVSPNGETPVDRIRTTGYIPGPEVGYVIGENLAWGTYQLSTPQSIVSAWIASPGHLANILEAQYRETGIGITPAVPTSLAPGAPGATYAQKFGVIIQ
jgi:uncharacterized protein YkwD